MAVLDQLNEQMKTAMKAKDKQTLSTVRMLKSALQNKQIDLGHDLTPEDEKAVLSTELKQRKESLEEFSKAGREDLVTPLEAEMTKLVDETIAEVGATGKGDFGKVMKTLMPKVKGQADGAMVNRIVEAKLG